MSAPPDDSLDSSPLLPPGLYEEPITVDLERRLADLAPAFAPFSQAPPPEASPEALSRHLARAINQALLRVASDDASEARSGLTQRLLEVLTQPVTGGDALVNSAEWSLAPPLRILHAIEPAPQPGSNQAGKRAFKRPITPLGVNALLTNARNQPQLVHELAQELDSADRLDILCSFIRWSGVRLLLQPLQQFLARPNTRLRVLTTTYTGATQAHAVEELARLPNTEVRVSYNTQGDRLHAKAYLFGRDTGFDTAYIGSSNLSRAALTEGTEWNIKIARRDSGAVWRHLQAAFESYWNDENEFEPVTSTEFSRLRQALSDQNQPPTVPSHYFDLQPFPFQQEILDRLQAERSGQGRKRHLVVAATGTGKTMIAAFDYRAVASTQSTPSFNRPRLLYIAHRKEILSQALASFRAVLRDNNFGHLLVDGARPENLDHVFASVQSYGSQRLHQLPPDHFQYVVVDEIHHSPASSYRQIMDGLQPDVLLGLTATPERADGRSVVSDFDNHLSAQIRLPEAIDRQLLCPFQYFGISDETDFSRLTWSRGGYDISQLDALVSANSGRAVVVLQELRKLVPAPEHCRALGFCVSVKHAEFMAQHFREAGLSAIALSGASDADVRSDALDRLRSGALNFIFSVDLFNEGLDLPQIDTVLLLRPTESLTIFLQQLGRGLRKLPGKECLTVLDFIGHSHHKFRFDLRFRALVSSPDSKLLDQVENGFPFLPKGCSIVLQKQAQKYVLENIRASSSQGVAGLREALRGAHHDLGHLPTLAEFLPYAEVETDDIYRRNTSFARLASDLGLGPNFEEPDETELTRGLRRLQHLNDLPWLKRLSDHFTGAETLPYDDDLARQRLLMCWLSLFTRSGLAADPQANDARLERNPTLRRELAELLDVRWNAVAEAPPPVSLPFPCPLQLHANYSLHEALAGLGHWTFDRQPEMREGVLHLPSLRTDAFFITLDKTPGAYSPSTMYRDYAISPTLFHWQSQSTTSSSSATGQRYIHGGKTGHTFLLFVREKASLRNLTQPYAFLGPADFQESSDDRPMNIVWKLRHPIPARLIRETMPLAA